MDDDVVPTVTILLLGAPECGKTTFISRLRLGPNADPSKPIPILRDIDQPFVFSISPQKNPQVSFRLEFYDNAAPDNYTLLEPELVILCYDVSNRSSLESVKVNWRKQVILHFRKDDRIPIMLLGLKRDLRDEMVSKGMTGGWVEPQEAYSYAQEMRCDLYAECSAVSGELMQQTFEDIVRIAVKTTTEEGGQSSASPCVIL